MKCCLPLQLHASWLTMLFCIHGFSFSSRIFVKVIKWSHVFWCGSPWATSKGGNHAYVPSNQAQLPDTYASVAPRPTHAPTQSGVSSTILHIQKNCPCSDRCWISLSLLIIIWHSKWWLTRICSWYQGGQVCLTESGLFLSLNYFICIVVSGISLGDM
jgi:hypothetical protein